MNYKTIIANMKRQTFAEAEAEAIPIRDMNGASMGKLVPVGGWILQDNETIELIGAWRQRFMSKFMTQFESTYDRTQYYLLNIAIAKEDRLFFMTYDEAGRLVGHLGIADVGGNSFELDNWVRGAEVGDRRFMHFVEVSLLDWCFQKLGIGESVTRVFSDNLRVIALHEEVGFSAEQTYPLRKEKNGDLISHTVVEPGASNVAYGLTKLLLSKEKFYERASWLN